MEGQVPGAATPSDPARLDRLERQVAELASRLAGLRQAEPAVPAAAGVPPEHSAEAAREQAISYAANAQFGKDQLVVRRRFTVANVLDADPDTAAKVFAALASPARITLLQALLDGPRTTQQLRGVLDDPSVGQLYHHLRELMSAGLVVQPGRSRYALPRGSQAELSILVVAAASLASTARSYPGATAQPPEPGDPPSDPGGQAVRPP